MFKLLAKDTPVNMYALESLSLDNLKSEYDILTTCPGAINLAEKLNKLPHLPNAIDLWVEAMSLNDKDLHEKVVKYKKYPLKRIDRGLAHMLYDIVKLLKQDLYKLWTIVNNKKFAEGIRVEVTNISCKPDYAKSILSVWHHSIMDTMRVFATKKSMNID